MAEMRQVLGLPPRAYQSAMMRADDAARARAHPAVATPLAAESELQSGRNEDIIEVRQTEYDNTSTLEDSASGEDFHFAVDADDVSALAPELSVTYELRLPGW
jgi:hypothetical protein